jgi:hypothetical protein
MQGSLRFRLRRHLLLRTFTLLVTVAALGASACPALAGDLPNGPTPPRLGFVDGDVSFWRPGAEDWTAAQVNTALAAGDSLYAGDGGNFELQSGSRAFVRGGANTELGLESLQPGYTQLKMTGGHAALDLQQLARGQTLEIDTPTAAFTVDRPGYYRIDVDENSSAFIARRGGAATVVPENGETVDLGENQQVVFGSTNPGGVTAAPALDAWDRWNSDRTGQLGAAPRSAQYVPREVAGVDDLDRYGDWRDDPSHGRVWVPRDTAPDWAPYSTGRWVYDPQYEWTWVDDAPWGWAPYHYGRWVNTAGYWGWAPGPIVAAPVYAPALVAFFGVPGIGVAVNVGLPFVSWCALGFGEPVIPWWGGSRFAGRPYWGGWGGPRYVNNVVVNNTTIINARSIDHFQNMNVRNAMVGIDRGQFGRGRGQHVRLDSQQHFQPMRGQLGVTPVAASLVPNERRGRRPPEGLRARQVVATRPPEDSGGRLRAKGLATTASDAPPQPRIVKGGRGVEGAPRRQSETTPIAAPPPPRGEHQPLGRGPGEREQAPPTPPPHGEQARAGRSPTRPGSAPPSSSFQEVPPPHGGRPRHGTSPDRPESAAPPAPPGQQHGGSHRMEAYAKPPQAAQRQARPSSHQRAPQPSARASSPDVTAHGASHQSPRDNRSPAAAERQSPGTSPAAREHAKGGPPPRNAAPPHGRPAVEHSATIEHGNPAAREPSAPKRQDKQHPQHEQVSGASAP